MKFRTHNNFLNNIYSCPGCSRSGLPHEECMKRFCTICCFLFNSKDELYKHCIIYHKEYTCEKCKTCFKNINNHNDNYH